MRGIDLSRYAFDFDLTFAALLMHPDGTVYHRYGGRDHRSADVWLTTRSFARVLRDTLDEHAEYSAAPDPPKLEPGRSIDQVPAYAKKDKGECIHCHVIFPALYEEATAAGEWEPDDIWLHPPPGRVGVDLDRDDQARLTKVAPGSPAMAAGLIPGDRLLELGPQRILTATDVSWALENAPDEGRLAVSFEREGERRTAEMPLPSGWRHGTPLSFSWRAFKWGLLPAPGFGGPRLEPAELESLGLERDAFAFRVGYLVTWGENQRFGHAVRNAGIRKGDVVVSIAGRRDFETVGHFHAWWRLTRKVGETVEIELRRGGEPKTVSLKVLE